MYIRCVYRGRNSLLHTAVGAGNHSCMIECQQVFLPLLPRARMREGVKELVLSVCLSVCQSGEKFLNLNIDSVK